MDQRVLVERARQGDHDAFARLVDPALARLDAAARLDPPGPGARARRGPGDAHPRLARPAGASRSRPVRRLAPSPDRQRLSRPRPEPATAPDRGRAHPHRLPPRSPTTRAPSPTASWSTRRSGASIPATARSSPCTTSWGCRCPRWRRPWASRWARRSPGCTTRSRRCAARRRRSRPGPDAGPRRAGRMTAESRFERDLTADPRGPVPGAVSRLSRRGPRGRVARGSGPRGPSQEGGSPWPTSPAGPRSHRACRGAPSGGAPHHRPVVAGRGRARRRLAPDQGPAAVRARPRNGLIAYATGGDIYTLDPVTGVTTAIVDRPAETPDRCSRPTARRSRSVAPTRWAAAPPRTSS